MSCEHRDPDLLLFGLGELAPWTGARVAWHLRSCARCRARRAELASVSRRVAGVLVPPSLPGGTGGGPGSPARTRPAGTTVSPLLLVLVLTVLLVSLLSVWYVGSHLGGSRALVDEGCLPGLPNDRCR